VRGFSARRFSYLQKPVEPKKILCIHDLSGVGRCSLAVILPVLSVMGFQPVALPTVVLSTHTGGLGTPARMDGSAYGMAALEHYQTLGLQFDCIYTGYLGGEAQVALAEKAFALWPAAYKVVDPVMGDNGKAYSTVTPALVERIRSLCRAADLILPNYTEAQLLLQQQPVTEQLDDAAAQALARQTNAIVAVTGEVDYVTDGQRTRTVAGGDPLMTRLVGTGCALSAVVAASCSLPGDRLDNVAAACGWMKRAGTIAVAQSYGPGSFASAFLDALHNLEGEA
jgi:pyridoxal/pyridoxine/pyridoxamine kinase